MYEGTAFFVLLGLLLYVGNASFVLPKATLSSSGGVICRTCILQNFVNATRFVLFFMLHPATWAFSIFSQFSFIFFKASNSALRR